MKLLRLKITDPKGFRSLQPGFEFHFRTEWALNTEQDFAPFVCAGPNGSGKSNLLEALAAIFFQMEVQRVRRSFLPEAFEHSEEKPQTGNSTPNGFELEYLIPRPKALKSAPEEPWAHVKIIKSPGASPDILWINQGNFGKEATEPVTEQDRDWLLPDYVLGYSSGENEILSLPFFKMRFIQYDEYWHALQRQLSYPGKPETRMAYLDHSFSQAILLCNLLFQAPESLKTFQEAVGLQALNAFRIIIRRSIKMDENQISAFGSGDEHKRESLEDIIERHPALHAIEEESGAKHYRAALTALLDGESSKDAILPRLKRCATCWYLDEESGTLYLDFLVNDATRAAFSANFDFETNNSPIALFQAFQVLLALNLYSVSETLKADLYLSDSHYVSETVPTLASDERIMRFKFVQFTKEGIQEPVMLKNLSDGEHQLLHSLGLCMLFGGSRCLFLLDEPETHFNPDWRSRFITCLHQCFEDQEGNREMLITTHTPFLISDSRPEKVLIFKKEDGQVSISHPDYNTLGASINKITMTTFGKRETIGGQAEEILNELRLRFEQGEDTEQLLAEVNQKLGDSVEKILFIKTLLDAKESQD